MNNVADHLDSLASVSINDGGDLSLCCDDVTNVKGGGAVNHTETIREVDQVEEVTVNRLREDRFHDSLGNRVRAVNLCARSEGTHLPSGDDAKIHRRLHLLIPCGFKRLTLITDDVAEGFDVLCGDGDLRAIESFPDADRWEGFIVTEPKAPIEVLDTHVATICNFVDGSGTKRRDVIELHIQRNSSSATFLKDGDVNSLRAGSVFYFNCFEVLFPSSMRADSAEDLDANGGETL